MRILWSAVVKLNMYLFVVQQTVGGGEADVMVGFELGGLVAVVELQTGSAHDGLQHFSFPVVDGDLQVIDTWLHG